MAIPSFFLFKNSDGKPDGMWTMSVWAFGVWMLHAIVLGLFGGSTMAITTPIMVMNWVIPANAFSWTSLSELVPLLSAYIVRKHGIGQKPTDPLDSVEVTVTEPESA